MNQSPLLGRADAVPRRRWRWLLPALVALALGGLVASFVVRSDPSDRDRPPVVGSTLTTPDTGVTTSTR